MLSIPTIAQQCTYDLDHEDGDYFPLIFGSDVAVAHSKHGRACEVQRIEVPADPGLVEPINVLSPIIVLIALGSQNQDYALNNFWRYEEMNKREAPSDQLPYFKFVAPRRAHQFDPQLHVHFLYDRVCPDNKEKIQR
jgi:hypothetical protein